MKPATVVFREESALRRFARVGFGRKHKKITRTIRELAMERLAQVEEHGDPAASAGTTSRN